MKTIKQLTIALFTIAMFWGCGGETIVYEGGNAQIITQYVKLKPNDWLPVSGANYEFYQPFEVPRLTDNVDEFGAVLVYMLDTQNNWVQLPQTIVLWTEDDITYSEEFWFSYKPKRMFFYYRNTYPVAPVDALPPNWFIDIKIVLLIGDKYQEFLDKGIDFSNYSEVMQAIDSDSHK